jgi:NADPH:quinone reductase-like Zn-dependent oxidoreductase
MNAQHRGDGETMKAIVYRRYGSPDVLELQDVAKPIPGDDQVLVRVMAVSVNPLDWHFLRGIPYFVRFTSGLRTPKRNIPGVDVAGRVDAVGRNVTRFKPGDEVFGEKSRGCAEYVVAGVDLMVPKPVHLTYEQAAAIPAAGVTALQALVDKGRVRAGQHVLINGASGGVGTFAVQIAKAHGAVVTGVCSTPNVDLVRSLGADDVIDYTRDDFTRSGRHYDLILDNVGNRSVWALRRVLAPDGTLVLVGAPKGGWILGTLGKMLAPGLVSRLTRRKVVSHLTETRHEDLVTLSGLIEAGHVTPVIDRCYPLREVADAIRYLETMRARGKVIITV